MEQTLGPITEQVIKKSLSYSEYRSLIDRLLIEGKTTGHNHTEYYLDYTRMNVQRMNRWDKTAKVSEEMRELIQSVQEPQTWVVITEGWCGDAAQNIPYLNKLAELNPNISLRMILRDEHPEVMDDYLTFGAKSIPKLVAMSSDLCCELFVWGPRPQTAQQMLMDYKHDSKGLSYQEFSETLHLWYARNKNQELESELKSLIESHLLA